MRDEGRLDADECGGCLMRRGEWIFIGDAMKRT